MKNKDLILPTAALLWVVFFVHFPPAVTDLRGKEWLTISKKKKQIICTLSDMSFFNHHGVKLKKSAKKYAAQIDGALLANPELANEAIKNILASVVYVDEPKLQPSLNDLAHRSVIKLFPLHTEIAAPSKDEPVYVALSPKLENKLHPAGK